MPISIATAVAVRALIKEAYEHMRQVRFEPTMKGTITLRCLASAMYEFNRGCEVSAIGSGLLPYSCHSDALENMQLLLRSDLEFAAHEEVAGEILEAAEAIRDHVLLLPLPH